MATWPSLQLWTHFNGSATPVEPPGSGGSWVDIGAYVRSASTSRGVSRFDGVPIRYEAGKLTAQLRNTDARFDPTNLSGPYVTTGVTDVKPGRHICLAAVWNATTYYLLRGFVDDWTPTYPDRGHNAVTIVHATDPMIRLAQAIGDGSAAVDPQTSGLRLVDWISADAGADYAALFDDFDEGGVALGAQNFDGNVLTACQAIAENEIGEFWFNGKGWAENRLRGAVLTDARSTTSQGTFGPSGSLPFKSVTVAYDLVPVRNHITAQRAGGAVVTATNPASISANGKRSISRTDLLLTTDEAVADWAGFVLALQQDAELRIDSIEIDPQASPSALFPHVLGRELGDRITVAFTPPGGSAISREVLIRGISHAITPTSWLTTWQLQAAAPYDAFLILDDATKGLLDTGRLG